jgi:hypothetical protein
MAPTAFAPGAARSRFFDGDHSLFFAEGARLLDGHGLGQVAGLVDVRAPLGGDEISE